MGERHTDELNLLEDSHHQILSDILGSKETAKEFILYSYKHGFSGFAAVLSQSQAKLIADVPGVVRVVPNRILNLHTTRSWDFLQVRPQILDGILSKGHSGLVIIIGVMDTGKWPESESFKDNGMRKFQSRWKGICQEGNTKMIGARWYIKGYEAEFGKLDPSDGVEFLSPRDASGLGTHTSSTACGALVENANFRGLAQGFARGGAPSSWLAIYKVCWATGGCSSADLLAAFDDAIFDGVDIISASLGSPPPLSPYVDDAVAIGSFHAVARGISVVCSAGNSGPYPECIINTAPWVITVAASTIDRDFPAGQSFYTGRDVNKFHPIVYGADIAASDSDGTSAGGKVVLCFQSQSQRLAAIASKSVLKVKGVGVIFAQVPTKGISCQWSFPCVQVDFAAGTSLLTYMAASRNPVVKFSFSKTVIGQQLTPEIAYFSSRGPSSLSPSVLKPDIAAPGVDILASWSPAASSNLLNSPRTKPSQLNFKLDSGTSMACPHISGIVALLKGVHPKWSPAAIKSALVTTASMKDEYGQNTVAEGAPHKQADPFDYGGGHVDPNKALDPGLVYDIETSDYVSFLCAMGYDSSSLKLMTKVNTPCHESAKFLLNLNLPSITIPELKQCLTISRTVTNVGPVNSVYVARVQSPAGTDVSVKPWILSFNSTIKKLKFKVTFCSQLKVQGRYSFGNLYWEDGIHVVRIPLIVRIVINNYSYSET
ncbi:Subtilase family protein, putative isoform 4 [Hibiscus syriacus]|uniref:Subtilase family protein, putative isoform 4 n=1 Tax=Hibiscus syriacus TaxID=106335 RepID=A0A6A3A4V6_HIBSY|nr:Subtilase family protein, putative isoform 4 [Hibiscus syriacus]